MSDRVRIIDIAKRAGVSKGTVDRVIHNRGNVSPDAKARIIAAMKDLDYQPNRIASALAYNRTWRIAALLPTHENDPFWCQPKAGIERALRSLRDYGLSVEFFEFRDADEQHFQELGNQILADQFDAVLIAPIFSAESHQFLDQCCERNIPYLQINTFLERKDNCFLCYIGQDSYQSGVLAAKLLDFGMSRHEEVMILHLEKEVYNSMHLVEKERGFEDYFRKNGKKNLQIVKTSFRDVLDVEGLKNHIKCEFERHPDTKGIFVTTSKLFRIVDLLGILGKGDVKLVGFDLIEENLDLLKGGKIDFIINQNPHKQGFLGVMNIFNHLVLKKELPHIQYLPLDVVMMENMQYYVEREEEMHLII